MSGANAAITIAARLDEIGFPEFTCKLVTDVFDALISANLRQVAAYGELMSSVSKSLREFINDTMDDIDGEEVLSLLLKILPDGEKGTSLRTDNSALISDGDRSKIKETLTIQDGTEVIQDITISPGTTYSEAFNDVCKAAAKRLAANKYDMLEKMMRMGFMRLVVETGTIDTRLNFRTYGYDYDTDYSSSYERTLDKKRYVPGLLGMFGKNMEAGKKTTLKVTTSSESSTSYTSTDINIFGGVSIKFKTDYMPLDKV